MNQPNWKTDWHIYGAGMRGHQVKRLLESNGGRVVGILDRKLAGKTLDQIEITHPDQCDLNGAHVVLGLFNFAAPFSPIVELLKGRGAAKIVSFYDFFEAFQNEIEPIYWLGPRDFYTRHEREIQQARQFLEDDLSRQIFDASLELRTTGKWQNLDNLRTEHQYFPDDVPQPQNLRMIDCGACLGDALQGALGAGRNLEKVWAFEPDLPNFAQLSKNAAQFSGETLIWPCGVWNQTTTLKFAGDVGAASHLDESGDQSVPIVALDEVLINARPNFLKMDIEGAESAALQGAANLIKENRPHLAICVYHRPEDLWAILFQVREMAPDYRFYLRIHQWNGFDLVLYAS